MELRRVWLYICIKEKKKINILGSGELKRNHSLRPIAVNFGWVIVATTKTAERHLTVTATGQSCRAHVQHRARRRAQVTWGQACRLRWQQRQIGGQKKGQLERKWRELDVWSKRNFTINKTLSSCEATCLQGLHRLQGLLLFQYFDNLVSIQESIATSIKQALKSYWSQSLKLAMC